VYSVKLKGIVLLWHHNVTILKMQSINNVHMLGLLYYFRYLMYFHLTLQGIALCDVLNFLIFRVL